MLSRTLVLLVATLLGSLADDVFSSDRRNNYNTNAKSNAINVRQLPINRNQETFNEYLDPTGIDRRAPFYSPKYGPHGRGIVYEATDADSNEYINSYRLGELCDEIQGTRPRYADDEEQNKRMYANMRGEDNINSNINNNVVGSRYRRTWNAVPYRSTYDSGTKYEKANPGRYMNSNVNTNVLTGRRSNANTNVNSNVNTNDLNHGGYSRPAQSRYPNLVYNGPDGWIRPKQFMDSLPTRYTTPPPYVSGSYRQFDDTAEDEDDEFESDDNNTNINSNVNILSRRNNMNGNSKSFSRFRRGVNNSRGRIRFDRKLDDDTAMMDDNESIAETRNHQRPTKE